MSMKFHKTQSESKLKPIYLEGSIIETYPKYNQIINKPKIPFFKVNKLTKTIGKD